MPNKEAISKLKSKDYPIIHHPEKNTLHGNKQDQEKKTNKTDRTDSNS